MENAVSIVLKDGSHTAGFFLYPSPGTLFAATGIGGQSITLALF
jgi:hypothetical protein